MAPRQMIDFLRMAERYHRGLQDFCETHIKDSEREEVKYLLLYIANHEHVLARAIHEYLLDASKSVLESWIPIPPEVEKMFGPEQLGFRPDMTREEIVDQVLKLDDALIAIYERLREESVSDELRETLDNMVKEEQRQEVVLLSALAESA